MQGLKQSLDLGLGGGGGVGVSRVSGLGFSV